MAITPIRAFSTLILGPHGVQVLSATVVCPPNPSGGQQVRWCVQNGRRDSVTIDLYKIRLQNLYGLTVLVISIYDSKVSGHAVEITKGCNSPPSSVWTSRPFQDRASLFQV